MSFTKGLVAVVNCYFYNCATKTQFSYYLTKPILMIPLYSSKTIMFI